MVITDKAKENLLEHLAKLKKDLLYIFLANSSCGHRELQLSLEDSKEFDSYEEINGIKVFIENEIKKDFEDVTMDYDGEAFMLKNLVHSHHHHEGECCCGDECDCDGDCDCNEGDCDCHHHH